MEKCDVYHSIGRLFGCRYANVPGQEEMNPQVLFFFLQTSSWSCLFSLRIEHIINKSFCRFVAESGALSFAGLRKFRCLSACLLKFRLPLYSGLKRALCTVLD